MMRSSPLILISPSSQNRGAEFADVSLSLSQRYSESVVAAGGIPWILPLDPHPQRLRECVGRCQGLMLTGGDDIQPQLYRPNLSKKLRGTVSSPDRTRDLVELLLVREAVRQHKPLLAICRGQQLLNVAFGGTLITDIPTECPRALNHQRFDRKNAPVHSINLAPDSQLARVLGRSTVRVNSTHHQAVARIGTGLRATAFSDDGLIEALESNLSEIAWSSFVLAVQFHPERLWPKYPEFLAIFETFIHACFGGSNKGL